MRVTIIDGTVLSVSWKHNRGLHHEFATDATHCAVRREPVDNFARYGSALTSKQDAFSKETGRKISLRRAIAGFRRDDRTKIWAAYFARKGEKDDDRQNRKR